MICGVRRTRLRPRSVRRRSRALADGREILSHADYAARRKEVLARDDWRCVRCGGRASDVHHLRKRSLERDDRAANLVSLCRGCHAEEHAR